MIFLDLRTQYKHITVLMSEITHELGANLKNISQFANK